MSGKVYLDANIWIYFLDGNSEFGEKSKKLFTHLDSTGTEVCFSALNFTEILGSKAKSDEQIAQTWEFVLGSELLSLEMITPITALKAAELRRKYGIRTADALHLATAITHNCEKFYTNDVKLKKIKEIEVEIL